MHDKKNIVVGILAHVDAGKTTLAEGLLYLAGRIKKLGRVDHRDSYLDGHWLERERGITIFSKQARLELEESRLSLLDTPGHVDFAAEMERTLSVLDCAVLVISGTDGVQAHTETLWELLRRHRLPCFIFVTKMDLPGAAKPALEAQLMKCFGEGCVDFSLPEDELRERLALCSEEAMDSYLSRGGPDMGEISRLIKNRELFPCIYGSGLRLQGVEELLTAIDLYAEPQAAADDFAARVFKIERDAAGKRLSFMKILGGELKVRDTVKYTAGNGEQLSEKLSQIRLYSGGRYDSVDSVLPGQLCAVTGLSETRPGQGLGAAEDAESPVLRPVLSYRLLLPKGADPAQLLPKLRQLGEEDPELSITWNESKGEISVELMGQIQAQVFVSLVRERFDLEVGLDSGSIMYKETIAAPVEAVGHFEPLRHYAEVHLIMEPLPPASGIMVESVCPEDMLDRNWQRLILSHLLEREHKGVLTGSPITDIKISLASGRAHVKHTEGGDFRQACYRAVRQGLMEAESVLLEPYYSFSMELPAEQIGRAISDIRAMNGSFSSPEERGEFSRIDGSAPVAKMSGYARDFAAYTHGRGKFSFRPGGYKPCREQAAVVEAIGYEPLSDFEHPSSSVFCAHGGGFSVGWDKVKDYMHLESCLKKKDSLPPPPVHRSINIDERELEAIMEREFGPIRRKSYAPAQSPATAQEPPEEKRKEYIIVDGYNLIFAWDELKALAAERLDLARGRLMDMLSNYCGYTRAELVLVFDGFRTPGNRGSREEHHNIHVAYTGDGETGDAYIERIAAQIGKNYSVRVVTSDNLIRLSALRSGLLRCSAKEFRGEVEWVLDRIGEILEKTNYSAHKTRLRDGKQ